MPAPIFEPIPDRQEARRAAGMGVRRGLLVGVASAAVLGLLLARTFRSSSLQDASAQTAGPTAPTPPPAAPMTPDPVAPGGAVPVAPPGLAHPNPYASADPLAVSQPGLPPVATGSVPAPAPDAASVPAMVIAAPEPGSRRATAAEARGAKPASYTDADLARVREDEPPAEAAPAPEVRTVPQARPAAPPPPRSAGQDDGRTRERREAVRAAQQRVDELQATIADIRREARENDDDGLQEELSEALDALKSAQRDLTRARRKLQEEVEDQSRALPPQ